MRITTPKPLNSEIQIIDEFNRTVIWWENPRGGASRAFTVLFLLMWLGGWAVGEFVVASMVLSGNANLFMIFWLAGWTVGGVFAIRQVYFLVRPSRPEKIILDTTSLTFEAGTSAFGGIEFNKRRNNDDDLAPANSKSRYVVPKNDLGEIRLERVGERQRLTFDYGAERVEVGFFLREPEREWLFSVLKQWRGGGASKRSAQAEFDTRFS